MSTRRTPSKSRRGRKAEGEGLPIGKIEIDFLIVADWAQAINGKLYVQGAAWDRMRLPIQEQPIDFAIAAGILVPWHQTNQEHHFSLSLHTEDGELVGDTLTGSFNMGRPAKSQPGQKLRTPLSARIRAKIPGLGAYQVSLVVNNDIVRSVIFYVVKEL